MPQPDDLILERLNDLAACLCAELTPAGADEVPMCLCIPVPGAFMAQAYVGEGEDVAWVRLADSFPSNRPGVQHVNTFDQVGGTSLMVEMGVMRCFPVNQDGSVDPGDLTETWRQQIRDLGAMRRAIQCCTGRSWSARDLVVGNYRPIGPEGDLVGGVISLALQV